MELSTSSTKCQSPIPLHHSYRDDGLLTLGSSVLTIEKLLKFAEKLPMPVYATTQNALRLGDTVPSLASYLHSKPYDKTRFSMLDEQGNTPGFDLLPGSAVALVGIESHICITQTALDLHAAGHRVYIIADGVSSCNRAEVGIALDRLRSVEGIKVTTSESWMYEVVGDANHQAFKSLFSVVKASMPDTKKVLESMPPGSKI